MQHDDAFAHFGAVKGSDDTFVTLHLQFTRDFAKAAIVQDNWTATHFAQDRSQCLLGFSQTLFTIKCRKAFKLPYIH